MRGKCSQSLARNRWPAVVLVAVCAATCAFADPPERSASAASLDRSRLTVPHLRAELRAPAPTEPRQDSAAAPAIKADPRSVTTSNTFMTDYLLPRMSARLGDYNSLVASQSFRNEPVDSVWRGDVERRIEKQAIRATRSAAREYLVDRWDLELDLRRGRASVTGGEGSNDDSSASKVRLGFAGARPRLTGLNATKNGSVKLSVDSAGRFGAAWHHAADAKTGFAFAADPANKRVEIGWASGF